MTNFTGLAPDSTLPAVFNLFPRNSVKLLQLLNDIMCETGELSRGEREAIAAFISKKNSTPYCVFFHGTFSEVFSGQLEETSERIRPLLNYASSLSNKDSDEIAKASGEALSAGWTEAAIYEVVEICGIFDYINNIVLAAGLKTPEGPMDPYPTAESLKNSYTAMADAIDS